jgi:hypothetical protein
MSAPPTKKTPRDDRIGAIAGFADTAVFAHFGLPRTLN